MQPIQPIQRATVVNVTMLNVMSVMLSGGYIARASCTLTEHDQHDIKHGCVSDCCMVFGLDTPVKHTALHSLQQLNRY